MRTILPSQCLSCPFAHNPASINPIKIAMPFASQSHIAQAAERSHVTETDWGLKALTAQ